MKQIAVKHLADGASTLAIGSGVGTSALGYWEFISVNHAGIGVLCTLSFGLIALFFNIYNSSKLNQAEKNKKEIEANSKKLDEHINETKTGIDRILDAINKTHEK